MKGDGICPRPDTACPFDQSMRVPLKRVENKRVDRVSQCGSLLSIKIIFIPIVHMMSRLVTLINLISASCEPRLLPTSNFFHQKDAVFCTLSSRPRRVVLISVREPRYRFS